MINMDSQKSQCKITPALPQEYLLKLGISPSALAIKTLNDFEGSEEIKKIKYERYVMRRNSTPLIRLSQKV